VRATPAGIVLRYRISGYHEDHGAPRQPAGRCRLLAAEGGIRAVLLKRRLDGALRLMLAANKEERSLTDIARCCGLGGTSQFRRAFRARFGMPPRHR
jgi:AraC-like DNA-binding protein